MAFAESAGGGESMPSPEPAPESERRSWAPLLAVCAGLGVDSSGAAVGRGTLRNNLAYTGTLTSNMTGTDAANNSWNLGVTLSDSQFQSVSTSGWDAPHQSDGSLPVLPNLRPAANSTLIDKGVDVGLPYQGRAPDLGAFETS